MVLTDSNPQPEKGHLEQSHLHVTMVSSEVAPFAKTGGLGDMVSSLAVALEHRGIRVSLIMPGYRQILKSNLNLIDPGFCFDVPVSDRREKATVLKATLGRDISVYFIRSDRYFDRDGLYCDTYGDYRDNAERFVFFSRAALEIARTQSPDVLHAHDWQSAFSIAFLKAQPHLYRELSGLKTAFTIHNMGYQGHFPYSDWPLLNLDNRFFNMEYLEFYGKINFLKGGIVFADAVTTVSPTYATEIRTPEGGFGLDGLMRKYAAKLTGILNGVDYKIWNPETDVLINTTYGPGRLAGKKYCKAELQRIYGLKEDPSAPVVAVLSRLAHQKGCDLVQKAMPDLMKRNVQFALLGTGEKQYQDYFASLPRRYPGRAGVRVEFDERLAHKLIAGADILLMPSRYEPGGLTQIYALKYGTIPVVTATGGLKDTVSEFDPAKGRGNGFFMKHHDAESLLKTADHAIDVLRDRKNRETVMRNAMSCDFSWRRSSRLYSELYKKLAGE